MYFLNTILDILFPPKCAFCDKSGFDICLGCLSEAPSAERESAKWIFPLYDYRHPVIKKSLWLLKYSGKKRIANVFAEIIYEKILEELSEMKMLENFNDPILLPIPLSLKRMRERGFNQAEIICEELMRINNMRHGPTITLEKNILYKPKDTEHQARIKDRRERLRNMAGTFAITKKYREKNILKDKNIILIDDILTTGATLSEAKKVLKEAGARKVIAFTVAH